MVSAVSAKRPVHFFAGKSVEITPELISEFLVAVDLFRECGCELLPEFADFAVSRRFVAVAEYCSKHLVWWHKPAVELAEFLVGEHLYRIDPERSEFDTTYVCE